jgi:hypothetical protein
LTVSVDAEKPAGGVARLRAGAEWRAVPLLALRAGFDGGDASARDFAAGLGLMIDHFEFGFYPLRRFEVDYAFSSTAGYGDRHDIALRLLFGD